MKKLMKKFTAVILAGAMITAMTGCGAKEQPAETYTSTNGNFTIDISGSKFEPADGAGEYVSINNGKYAYGITQIIKADVEKQGMFTFDKFSSDMKEQVFAALKVTDAPEVAVSVPNLKTVKAWSLDLTSTTGTNAMFVLAETEEAFYQFIAESKKKDYKEDLFIKALGTLTEVKDLTRPEEVMETFTSESGKFSIDLPGTWISEDTGAGALLTKDNIALLKIEMVSKEEAAAVEVTDLDSFVALLNSSAEMAELEAKTTMTEETYDPGKFLASKAFLYDGSETDDSKQMFIYLESEKNFISFNVGSTSDGFDTIFARYGQVIQGVVEE